jgi:hypothetical protein
LQRTGSHTYSIPFHVSLRLTHYFYLLSTEIIILTASLGLTHSTFFIPFSLGLTHNTFFIPLSLGLTHDSHFFYSFYFFPFSDNHGVFKPKRNKKVFLGGNLEIIVFSLKFFREIADNIGLSQTTDTSYAYPCRHYPCCHCRCCQLQMPA